MIEAELMRLLAGRIAAPAAHKELQATARRLSAELHGDPSRPKSTFAAVPLELYGGGLPVELRSSWVFALRGGLAHPPEYHPNSIQRMFALGSPGTFETWGVAGWTRQALGPGDDGLSIPAGVWHRMPAQLQDWTVVSFHTVAADELVEILGDPETGADGASRRYLPASPTA